jgi:UDP-glucose 4-epimerase
LAQRLVEDGYTVHGLVRHTTRRSFAALGKAVESVRFIEGDVADYHSLQSAVVSSAPEIVVHLAALTPVRLSFDDPLPYMRVNSLGTTNLVHAVLERTPNAKVILASSAEVYGWQPKEPTKETARLYPSSPYGVSKTAADTYVQMAMRVYGLKAVVLRSNNTYGRGGDSNFLTEYAINAMIHGKPVYVGAPTHVRDYMHVDDHVKAYLLAVKNDSAIGNVFNISPGNPTSNLELVKKIANLTGYEGKIVEGSYPPGYPTRPSEQDTEYIVLDSSKIRNQLDWKPSISLQEGLQRTIEAWRRA